MADLKQKRFLIVNIFGIGDVLFTTPLVRNIKENCPDAYIGYVCNKRARTVLDNNPCIDRLFIYERDDYYDAYKESKIGWIKKGIEFYKELKKEQFDVVIDLSLNSYFSFFTWSLGIKERIGFNYKNRSPYLSKKIAIKGFEKKHVTEHYLSLLEKIGIPVLQKKLEVMISEQDQAWTLKSLNQNGINDKDLVVGLVPGGGASWGKDSKYRRWDPKKHAKLADKIIEKFSAKIILLGDQSEFDLGQDVINNMNQKPIDLIGKTTIGQYLALLSKCQLVVVNDGGPLHMAVAAGAKTVSLIGPVDRIVYGPYPPDNHVVITSDIACRPCYRRFRRADCDHVGCLNQITIDEVFSEVAKTLEK